MSAIILAALVAVALVVVLGLTAAPADAQQAWTTTTCGTCHNYAVGDAFHQRAAHAAQTCQACHSTGYSTPSTAACANAACHGSAAQIVAARPTTHTTCSGASCHGSTPTPTPTATATSTPTPTPTATATKAATTLTAKAAPTTVTLGKKVKVSGLAGPVPALVGAKIALKVERKVGTKWVKMKTASTTAGATGAYAWSYKTVKKGAHRVTVSVAATTTFTAKKLVKTFKVR